MRKRIKRLNLNRETLRNLQYVHLQRVAAGGGETFEIDTTCACTDGCGGGTGGCGSGGCGSGGCTGTCTLELITTCRC